jgi:hypothetical protein
MRDGHRGGAGPAPVAAVAAVAAAGCPSLVIHVPLPPIQHGLSHMPTLKSIACGSLVGAGRGGGLSGRGGSATVAAAVAAAAAAGCPSLLINVPLPLDPAPDKSHANT